MPFDQYDRVRIINLAHREDRRAEITAELQLAGVIPARRLKRWLKQRLAMIGTRLCQMGLHSWRLTDEREFSMGFNTIALRSKECRRCPAKGANSREVSASNPRPPETAYTPEV